MPIKFDFTGRKVILTGAAGDIGSVIAKRFLEAGAKLFATDRPGGAGSMPWRALRIAS